MKHIIENNFLKATIIDTGATLQSLKRKEDSLELIVSFEESYYQNNMEAHGAIVGPSAGRIYKSSLKMNGKSYKIKNFDKCLLHSGEDRICHKKFELVNKTPDSVVFKYFYHNADFPFFSDQEVVVKYILNDKKLICEISSNSDEEKIMNYTNHTYFTLGASDSRKLELKGEITKELEIVDKILTGNIINISKKFNDFNKYNLIDNAFILDGKVYLRNPNNNINLEISSNQKAVVLYNDAYSSMKKKYKGFAIEMQGYPSAITFPDFPQNVYKKNSNIIEWQFNW